MAWGVQCPELVVGPDWLVLAAAVTTRDWRLAVRSHNMAARGPSRESRPGLGASFMSLTTVLSLLQL